MTAADQLTNLLSEELDLPPLSKGEGGCYWLAVGSDFEVGIGALGEGLFFTAQVGRFQGEKLQEENCALLLLANLFGQGSGFGTLGLDEKEQRVLFHLLLPEQMSTREYRDHFEAYLNDARYWVMKIGRWA